MPDEFDVLVVGGGIAGLTAGLFTVRHGLKTALVEANMVSGQVVNVEQVENYPGFPRGIAGLELGSLVQEQALAHGLEMIEAEATGLSLQGEQRVVATSEGELAARAAIIAAGSRLRKLGVPGEDQFHGRGLSYCASCDGPLFAGRTVAVVGGGDAALDEALILARYAERVLLLHRRDAFRAQQLLQKRVSEQGNIAVCWNTRLTSIQGNGNVTGIAVQDTHTGEEGDLAVQGVFLFVGLDPNTVWLADTLPLDNSGHIPVDLWMRTPVAGVFAAGDIRQHSAAQLVTAAGDGATAALAAYRYVTRQ